jgi:hypothetical protein
LVGYGVAVFSDGSKYAGQWNASKPHGFGVFSAKGLKYVGHWRNGWQDGNGTGYFDNAKTYAGEWKNRRFHGKGCFVVKSGFEGENEEDNPEFGTFQTYDELRHKESTADGDYTYDGDWKEGNDIFFAIP